MRLYVALLTSVALHLSVILGPDWLSTRAGSAVQPRIEVRLPPLPEDQDAPAQELSTEVANAAPLPPAPTPRQLRGEPLRRAQTALTRHLFYPPEAIAQGMEGEVVLLLTADEAGRLTAIEVARSSGYAILDQAARDAARQIGRLPGARRQMLFPVNFRLQ